jgi:hypothetical protein
MKRPEGGSVEDAQEGYDLRREQIELKLGPMSLHSLHVEFFNCKEEPPEPVRATLLDRLARLRGQYAGQIGEVARAVDQLIANQKEEQVRLVFEQVERQLWSWINKNRELDWQDIPVQRSLVDAIDGTKVASVVNASVIRQGDYPNLDYYHHLGAGAQVIAARLIGEKKIRAFRVIVQNQIDNEDFAQSREFLDRLLKATDAAVDSAYRNVYLAGREVFKEELRSDRPFWDKCRGRWGGKIKSPPYRDQIRDWTDEQVGSQYDDAHKVLQRVISDEWVKVVGLLERLLKERSAPVPTASNS